MLSRLATYDLYLLIYFENTFFFIEIKVLEYDLDYTDTNCLQSGTNQTCADYLQGLNYTGANCTCTINFQLDNDFNVCFYFELINILIKIFFSSS